jgi:hypothetical protein
VFVMVSSTVCCRGKRPSVTEWPLRTRRIGAG